LDGPGLGRRRAHRAPSRRSALELDPPGGGWLMDRVGGLSPGPARAARDEHDDWGCGSALRTNLAEEILAAGRHHNPVTTFPLRLIQGLIGTLEYFGNPHPFTFAGGGDPEADGERNLPHGGRHGVASDAST